MHPDVNRPATTIKRPIKTRFNTGHAFSHCRVSTIHPAWSMRIAVLYIDTGGSHLIAGISAESVPSWS